MRLRVLAPFLLAVALGAGCGGGGGGGSSGGSVNPPVTTSPPTPPPTAAPTPATGASAVGSSPFSIPLPTGYSGTATLPISGAVTLHFTTGPGAPSGSIPALAAARALAATRSSASSSFTDVFSATIVPAAGVTIAGPASLALTFPSGVLSAGNYYLAFYDPTVAYPAWGTIAGPAQPSGTTLTFSGTIPTYTLGANQTYGLTIFTIAQSGASPPPAPPTPTPTPSPSPSPGALSASWTGAGSGFTGSAGPFSATGSNTTTGTAVNFSATGQSATVALSQPNFGGTYSYTSSGCTVGNNGNVSVTQSGSSFTVADLGTAYSCSLIFSGAPGFGTVAFPINGPVSLGGSVQ